MKLSIETLKILKNFSGINQGILLTPGNTLQTRTKAVLGMATIAETFPRECGIYDVGNFLSVVGLFDDPDFDFAEECLYIKESDGHAETQYSYAGAGLVPSMNTKRKTMELPPQTVDFMLSEDQWATLLKASSVLQKPEIKVVSDGLSVKVSTENHEQPANNAYSLIVDGESHGFSCNMIFSLQNMKLLKGDYKVSVTPSYAQFKYLSGLDLIYLIGAEPTSSTFNSKVL